MVVRIKGKLFGLQSVVEIFDPLVEEHLDIDHAEAMITTSSAIALHFSSDVQ